MLIATVTAERSTCVRRKAGAVAFDGASRVVSMGYNGVPKGVPHCIDTPCPGAEDKKGSTERCMAVHAEVNCIINAHSPRAISRMYVTASPCFKCALVLINLPSLESVFYTEAYTDFRGIELLTEAGLVVLQLTPHTDS